MILGRIVGKTTTNDFKFLAEKDTKKFEYIQVYHQEYEYILCQILEIEKDSEKTICICQVIGYKSEGRILKPRMPLDTGSEVLLAETEFIKEVIKLENTQTGAILGKLDGTDIDVSLDLNKVLTTHMAVLAKSGSGKSYSVGVLLEEMILRKIPLLVIDPHGEYSDIRYKNDNEAEIKKLSEFKLKPKGFPIQEYGDQRYIENARPLVLPKTITQNELLHMMPSKLSNSQLACLYSSIKNQPEWTFESLLMSLEQEENSSKWSVMNLVEYLRNLDIFSDFPMSYNELISSGKCSILNLKGIPPDVQQIIVYKVTKDLFELRKKNKIPPFFLVVEEAHNYCPERSFGETKSSQIIRTIASEGRKFGLGLCIISQRPARVDKSVLSQCSTQLILKVTNPNDLKALSASVEGLTSSTEKEIQNIPIGTALVTGLTDVPLFTNIRPKMSRHGGRAEQILDSNATFVSQVDEFDKLDMLPLIKPNTTLKDLSLMSDTPEAEIVISLIPCYQFVCSDSEKEFKLLVELIKGTIIIDKETNESRKIPDIKGLSNEQVKILKIGFQKGEFSEEDVIAKLNTSMEIKEDLDILENLTFVKKEGNKYKLNEEFIFSKLSTVQSYDKIKHEQIKYKNKLEKKIDLDILVEMISRFTTIKDKSECYLVSYK